jgi:hypothetical protein
VGPAASTRIPHPAKAAYPCSLSSALWRLRATRTRCPRLDTPQPPRRTPHPAHTPCPHDVLLRDTYAVATYAASRIAPFPRTRRLPRDASARSAPHLLRIGPHALLSSLSADTLLLSAGFCEREHPPSSCCTSSTPMFSADEYAVVATEIPRDEDAVVIAGGGVAGLTAALALKQVGRTMSFCEMRMPSPPTHPASRPSHEPNLRLCPSPRDASARSAPLVAHRPSRAALELVG